MSVSSSTLHAPTTTVCLREKKALWRRKKERGLGEGEKEADKNSVIVFGVWLVVQAPAAPSFFLKRRGITISLLSSLSSSL